MANKTVIQDYPLLGDLNLSKNKLDIEESGFLYNDGVFYGGTLSPIWKDETSSSFDFYDKNGNGYSIGYENGALTDKDGNTLLSYDPTPFVEHSLQSNLISKYDTTELYEYSDRLETQNNSFYFEENEVNTFFKAKMIDWNIAAILVLNTDNEYHIIFYDFESSDILDDINLLWTEIGDAFITSYSLDEDNTAISVFSDSGSDFDGKVKTFILNFSSDVYTVYNARFQNNGTGTVETPEVKVKNWKDLGIAYANSGHKEKNYLMGSGNQAVMENTVPLTIQMNPSNPSYISEDVKIKVYFTPAVSSNYNDSTWSEAETWNANNKKPIDTLIKTTIDSTDIEANPLNINGHISMANITRNFPDLDVTNLRLTAGKSYLVGTVEGIAGSINLDPQYLTGTSSSSQAFLFPCVDETNIPAFGILWIDILVDNVSTFKAKLIPMRDYGPMGLARDSSLWSLCLFYKMDNSGELLDAPSTVDIVTSKTVSVKPLVECNGILNNGQIINTQLPSLESDGKTFTPGGFAVSGVYDALWNHSSGDKIIRYSTNDSSLVYLGLVNSYERAYPYTFVSRKIALDPYYIRYTLHCKGGNEEVETTLTYDNGLDKILVNAGYNANTLNAENGSRITEQGWGILYNRNNLSALSYTSDDEKIGSLLTDWDYLDEIICIEDNVIIYRNSAGNVIEITHIPINGEEEDVWKFKVILNRFLLLNTGDFLNCWDTYKNEAIHFASDYNDRFLFGTKVVDYLGWTTNTRKIFDDTLIENFIEGSGYNVAYTVTNNTILGYKPAPNLYRNVYIGENPIQSEGLPIEVYYSPSETTATYKFTYKNKTEYKDSSLENTYFTDSVIYSPNMFTRFIETWNMNDLVINNASKTAYPLLKYNGIIFLGYLLVNGLENAENVFVVQTLYYMVSDGKIWEIVYNNGSIDNFICVANIKNMRYIGCLPTMAIFYSDMDKTFWSFCGDAILRRFIQANDIGEITGTFYNTATQELFVGTDIGLLCINDINNYLITGATNVNKMFFFDKYFIYGQTGIDGSGDDSGGGGKDEGEGTLDGGDRP